MTITVGNMCMKTATATALFAFLVFFTASASAGTKLPPLLELAPAIARAHPELVEQRARLLGERDGLRSRTDQHNASCSAVEEGTPQEAQCSDAFDILDAELEAHAKERGRYNELAASAIRDSMKNFAKTSRWDDDSQKRLDTALAGLDADLMAASKEDVVKVWKKVLARADDGEFARLASKAAGSGFPGAGTQSKKNDDCAIFALANAAGQPYGVVAARATGLIRDGEWRSDADRAAPQAAIEKNGLMGGEVILLAEAFGQAEIVSSAQFEKTLKEGRPVLVNVVPKSGDLNAGHQVVLAKTFQHKKETWYQVMDSSQGPVRRLYFSASELRLLLQENGIAFRPEEGTVPQLLK